MHIFIDESGSFGGVGNSEPSISVLGALIIPSHKLPKLFARYNRLRLSLPKRNGEVKGSGLNEEQIGLVVDLLRKNEAILCASMIDMADHSIDEIEFHRAKGINALAANLQNGHTPELRANIAALQERMKSFSSPLYAQMMVTLDLLHRVMEEMIGYHCQRNPKELSSFHWVVDAKQPMRVTDWEDWWSNTLIVWLQSMSMKRPGMLLKSGDYRHFKRFFFDDVPDYLQQRVQKSDPDRPAGVDLQKLFREHFRFSSEPEPGLELADIVTNCIRRALVGTLQQVGWLPLRDLMINRRDATVRPVTLHFRDQSVSRSYSKVLFQLSQGQRQMFVPRK